MLTFSSGGTLSLETCSNDQSCAEIWIAPEGKAELHGKSEPVSRREFQSNDNDEDSFEVTPEIIESFEDYVSGTVEEKKKKKESKIEIK